MCLNKGWVVGDTPGILQEADSVERILIPWRGPEESTPMARLIANVFVIGQRERWLSGSDE